MGVPNVVYKWKSLRTLYVSVFVMNVAGCVIVVIMIVSAVKLRLGLGQYLDLVVPGDANFWPGMMFLIAFLCAPIYAIGIKLCFHLRFSSPDSIPRLNKVLFVHCILCFASMILVVGINAVGMLRMVDLHRVNRNGIIESMQEYATEIISKTKVDMIQINFRCCGSTSFKDWFHVKWIQKEGEKPESRDRKNETALVSTDVPFSCCATGMLKPCIHHNILQSSEVYLYQPEQRLTISTTGCHAKVLSHARYVGGLLIVGLILLAAYQMVLALLSRLLQTAHTNAFYIGPRKDRYLAWILGSMPKAEAYNRLVYERRDGPAEEEIVPLRGLAMDCQLPQLEKKASSQRSRGSGIKGVKRPLGKRSSKTSNAERHSVLTLMSQEEGQKLATTGEMKKEISSNIAIANSIPTPPPSPGTEPEITSGLDIEQISAEDERKGKTGGARTKKEMVAKVSGSRLKELRESLECLEQCQLPWKGGSPIFEIPKSASSSRSQSSRDNDFVTRGKGLPESELKRVRSSPSSSSSSSDKKRHKVCGKDSFEEDEIRIKKFCKDLSTEYKKSPYSKQRRDFSEEYERQDLVSIHPHMQNQLSNTDDGRMIRNQVCAKFNPADAYSRFRGSTQDTMMRRSSQTHPQPPPIPISDQRTVRRHDYCRPCQQFSENPQFIARPLLFDQFPKPQTHAPSPSWSKQQRLRWGPRRPPAPTYFPISSRPPRPPRLPPCPYASRDQTYAHNTQNNGVRGAQFAQNMETAVGPRFKRCPGRLQPGLQPPRFSGC